MEETKVTRDSKDVHYSLAFFKPEDKRYQYAVPGIDSGVIDSMRFFFCSKIRPHPSRAEAIQLCPVDVPVLLTPDDGLAGHPEVRPRPEQRPLAPSNGGLGRGCLQ